MHCTTVNTDVVYVTPARIAGFVVTNRLDEEASIRSSEVLHNTWQWIIWPEKILRVRCATEVNAFNGGRWSVNQSSRLEAVLGRWVFVVILLQRYRVDDKTTVVRRRSSTYKIHLIGRVLYMIPCIYLCRTRAWIEPTVPVLNQPLHPNTVPVVRHPKVQSGGHGVGRLFWVRMDTGRSDNVQRTT